MNKTIKNLLAAFAASLLLPACGTSATQSPPRDDEGSQGNIESEQSSSRNEPKPDAETKRDHAFHGEIVEVEVSNGDVKLTPGEVSVAVGDNVRIEIVSDAADEVHVHGYDVTKRVRPGRETRVDLKADIPGVFEIELEESGTALFELTVR